MHRLGGDDPQRLGPYRLKAVVGNGGMGRVYLGSSPGGRAVAVKVIGRGLAERPGYRERFAREARAAMAVSGLYTASVVNADTDSESPYIATEFVPAPSLAEAVSEAGPLPVASVVALAGGMAEALVAIHRAGLVHRDVKPHNILLAADGPVVIDFGIAVGADPSLTATGITVGTPGYMAPEVLRGADPSARSDVFALGSVLVYAARGTGPFGSGSAQVVAHRVALGEPDLDGVPEQVRALVTPMLRKDPARRSTPEQLLQDVSLSSSAILLDGMWLPESVRSMLERRRIEVQWALNDGFAKAERAAVVPPGVGKSPLPPVVHAPAPAPAQPQPPAAVAGPRGSASPPPHAASPGARTPAQDAAVLHGAPPPGAGPKRRSQRPFFAAVALGGAVVLVGAVLAVLVLSNGSDGTSAAGSSHSPAATSAHDLAAGGSPASSGDPSAGSTPSQDPNTSSTADTAGTAGSGGAGYAAGSYPVGSRVAVDTIGDTVALATVTVNGDGSVSAQLTYTAADSSDWTCAASQPGEATLAIGSGTTDQSTGSDCTKDPTRTWHMRRGQTVTLSEYFAAPPAGSGSWTFALDSLDVQGDPEFAGEVGGIEIPTD